MVSATILSDTQQQLSVMLNVLHVYGHGQTDTQQGHI